ncbi:MAG: helix-turn-helix transcriptional regulator, partial [Hamadaea sp.]|nr:helix-turn-helix transcriptional regulator [Hamadaea sp.]
RTARTFGGAPPGPDGTLAGQLGAARAAALNALARRPGAGTLDVAAELGVAASTASEHIAHLRRAGLVGTVRAGGRARHTPTPLGWHLLDHFL